MSVAVVFLVAIVLLFGLAFLTKRRFGVLGLALAAGSIVSELWAAELTPIIQGAGLVVQSPPLVSIISVVLVLAPAVLLLFSGPSYHATTRRVIGALLFAVLAFAFIIEPLGSALVLQGDGRTIYEHVFQNRDIIITLGLGIAVFDLLGSHAVKTPKPEKH